MKEPCIDGIILNPEVRITWIYVTKLHTNTHIYKHAHKTGEIWMKTVICIQVNFLVILLYYSDITHYYHWRKSKKYVGPLWLEKHIGFLCIISCNYMYNNNYFKVFKILIHLKDSNKQMILKKEKDHKVFTTVDLDIQRVTFRYMITCFYTFIVTVIVVYILMSVTLRILKV